MATKRDGNVTRAADEIAAELRRVALEYEQLEKQQSTAGAQQEQLEERVRDLTARCRSLGDRLRRSNARITELQEQQAELAAAGPDSSVTQLLFRKFVEHAGVTIRPEVLAAYYARLCPKTPAEVIARHRQELEATNYSRLLEQLFAEEMLYTRTVDARNLREFSSFQRGERDLANARRAGKHLHEVIKPKLDITHGVLTTLIKDEDFDKPPERICEIGGAWGATIKHLTERFAPLEYQNYEIDKSYASWAEHELGAVRMPVDGETLSATDDASMDLVVANNVLFFMPPIKAWSYMRDMARVVRRGGLVLFNALVADRCDEADLEDLLAGYFPRRAFSLLPEHFIRMNFARPHFTLLRSTTDPGSETGPYFVFKRVRGTRKRQSDAQ